MTTVAILGTGKMGGAMARRLAASGLQVVLWNRTRDRAEGLHLGRVAATPAEATREAEVVISSLTNDAAVRDVYLGDNGALRTAAEKLLIDASTAGPRVAEELGRDAEAAGARLLEAPVIGSVQAVESGKLLILASGDPADLEQAQPILEHLGEVRYVGRRGNAPRLKLIANSMLGVTSAAAAELLSAGEAMSLDREQVFSILARFAPALSARERGFLHDQHTPPMFAVRDLVKDLDLGLAAYSEAAVSTPLTREARELYARAMRDSADLDISAVIRGAPVATK
ncbi:MAG: 3-hydroxyisobutyrate dehydrogenase [Chloroflexota bacterium]|jgi:3-hydroxyisobutyrate dehydrogenase/2-hydroxy-3-oxopropionate reductase|nr:3-hydroxyisobutyrate dehydrogenase [Chloroflexota bacterium]